MNWRIRLDPHISKAEAEARQRSFIEVEDCGEFESTTARREHKATFEDGWDAAMCWVQDQEKQRKACSIHSDGDKDYLEGLNFQHVRCTCGHADGSVAGCGCAWCEHLRKDDCEACKVQALPQHVRKGAGMEYASEHQPQQVREDGTVMDKPEPTPAMKIASEVRTAYVMARMTCEAAWEYRPCGQCYSCVRNGVS